jgi:hypothetical protein
LNSSIYSFDVTEINEYAILSYTGLTNKNNLFLFALFKKFIKIENRKNIYFLHIGHILQKI